MKKRSLEILISLAIATAIVAAGVYATGVEAPGTAGGSTARRNPPPRPLCPRVPRPVRRRSLPPPSPRPARSSKKVADGFEWTEGAGLRRRRQRLFHRSAQRPHPQVRASTASSPPSCSPPAASNGMCFDAKGNLWACADEKNELWCIDLAGKVTVVVKDYEGKLLNGPNDVWVRPDGGAVLHRPDLPAALVEDAGPRSSSPASPSITSRPTARSVTRVVDDLKQPNGIIGTPDGKTLYVADIGDRKTYVLRRPARRLAGRQASSSAPWAPTA